MGTEGRGVRVKMGNGTGAGGGGMAAITMYYRREKLIFKRL